MKASTIGFQRLNQRRADVASGIESRDGAIQHLFMKRFLFGLASEEVADTRVGGEGSLAARAALRQAFPQSKGVKKVCDAGVYIKADVHLFAGGGRSDRPDH